MCFITENEVLASRRIYYLVSTWEVGLMMDVCDCLGFWSVGVFLSEVARVMRSYLRSFDHE